MLFRKLSLDPQSTTKDHYNILYFIKSRDRINNNGSIIAIAEGVAESNQ